MSVPRSPNRHLDEFRVVRKFDMSGGEIEFDRFAMFSRASSSVWPADAQPGSSGQTAE